MYDGNGNRHSKTVNGQTRYYSYDAGGNIVSEYKRVMVNGVEKSQTLVRYVRDNAGKTISMLQYSTTPELPNSTTYYYVYNGHGDVTALTDSTGTVVATYSYDEFGNQLSVNGQPSTVNEQGIYNPLRYSGAHNAYYDSETGLYKMGARYYQSDIGRWLTRDEYLGNQEQPQTKNRYVYTENNPLTKVDPSGYMSIPKALSYARKGDILAIVNKKTKAFIPGHYSHTALAFSSKTYGESSLYQGDGTKKWPITRLIGEKNVTEVVVLRVNTSGVIKNRTVRYANWLVGRNIPYALKSDYRRRLDGMNCTEFVWRSYYVGSRRSIDLSPARLHPTIVIAPQSPVIIPDEIAGHRLTSRIKKGVR